MKNSRGKGETLARQTSGSIATRGCWGQNRAIKFRRTNIGVKIDAGNRV